MIDIYGSSNCIWCLKAKQLCETMDLEHNYILVDEKSFIIGKKRLRWFESWQEETQRAIAKTGGRPDY